MLVGPIMAMVWEEQVRATAVRKLSESAARWAHLLLVAVGLEFWVRRFTCIADSKRYCISPENAALMRSRIHDWIEVLFRCWVVDGEKISMSRCRRSHQNGAEVSCWCGVEYAVTMDQRTEA
jgi:hypothetical protein